MKQPSKMKFAALLSGSVLAGAGLTLLISCGAIKTGSKHSGSKEENSENAALACGEASNNSDVKIIRLKGADLLIKAIEQTLGPGKHKTVEDANKSIFDDYATQFGTTSDLSFGDIYADLKSETLKMTSYTMALNIVARNAALHCSSEGQVGLCKCDDKSAAAAMLSRAVPYRSFCAEGDDAFVRDFSELCKEDQLQAVTSLISSTAFALRN